MELLRAYADAYVQRASHTTNVAYTMLRRNIWAEPDHSNAIGEMQAFLKICLECDLPVTRVQVERILANLTQFRDGSDALLSNSALASMLHELNQTFEDELSTKLFFQVQSSKKTHFDNPREGWEEVISRFPDAGTDIEEMRKCFALSRYGGCVFHSLLVTETGLIALGVELHVSDPKPGWDASCNAMKRLLEAGHSKYPRDVRVSFADLEQINAAAQAMKLAWRNKVNHAAGHLVVINPEFAPDIAEEIMNATRSFMRRLATDLPKRAITRNTLTTPP